MTVPFKPSKIYIDTAVQNLPLTQKILSHFPSIPTELVPDAKKFKKRQDISWAKKGLRLAQHRSDRVLKPFEAQSKSCGLPYYSLDLISNCHLECTYCILQSYLTNNPVITIYTNVDEILEKLGRQLEAIHDLQSTIPAIINTGRIADSLALEPITGLNRILIPFFAKQKRPAFLELKTKSDSVDEILNLDHQQKTILSWSMNPEEIVEREEFKTASVDERLNAAKKCLGAGYKIGFHLDPMIHHENWQNNYCTLIEKIFNSIAPEKIHWMSLGVLRFPERQKRIIENRFPKNKKLLEGLQHTHLPFLTYSTDIQKDMIFQARSFIQRKAPNIDLYTCMELE